MDEAFDNFIEKYAPTYYEAVTLTEEGHEMLLKDLKHHYTK